MWSSTAALVVLYLASVRTMLGQRLDDAAMRQVARTVGATSWAELTLHAVSVASMLLATGLVVTAAAVLRGHRRAMIAAGAAGLVIGVAELLKLVLERPVLSGEAAANSFPSGHVAAVSGLAVAVVVAVPRVSRGLVAVLAMGPVALTGLATVVLQWHRPSDVVGSMVLAVAIGALATHLADGRGIHRVPLSAGPSLLGGRGRGQPRSRRLTTSADSSRSTTSRVSPTTAAR